MEELPPCGICQLPILQNQAKAELYCFHRVHTACLQGEVDTNPEDAFICFVCNAANLHLLEGEREGEGEAVVEGPAHPEHGEPVLLNPEEEEEHQEHEEPPINRLRTRDRIRQCLQQHPEYKRDLQTYIKTRSEISAAHRELTNAIRLKKDPVRAEVLLLKHQIDEHLNRLKGEIHQTQEFKSLRSKTSKLSALERKIERNFHQDFYDIRRALRDQRGLRRLQSSWRLWYHRPARVMRRAFYFRLRF